MKTIAVIMAHKGTEEICARHLPYWRQNADELYTLSPGGFEVEFDAIPRAPSYGVRCHHGRIANERLRHAITWASTLGADRAVIHEYDSVCVGPLPDTPMDALAGNFFRDPTRGGGRFAGTGFIHPPLVLWSELLLKMADLLHQENMNAEGGFWDRMLAYMCERRGIPIYNFIEHGLGYSQNTIHPGNHDDVRAAMKKGSRLYHGIKTEEAFKVVTERPARRGRGARLQPR